MRTHEPLYSASYPISSWIDAKGAEHHCHLTFTVFDPRGLNDVPGILIRLNTPSATAFVRTNALSLRMLSDFILSHLDSLTSASVQATEKYELLKKTLANFEFSTKTGEILSP